MRGPVARVVEDTRQGVVDARGYRRCPTGYRAQKRNNCPKKLGPVARVAEGARKGTARASEKIALFRRARSSVAERAAHNRLVVGSTPTGPTDFPQKYWYTNIKIGRSLRREGWYSISSEPTEVVGNGNHIPDYW